MKKEFNIVCTSLFLLLFGTYISGTLLVPYAKSLGGTGITIGIIYSCMYVVRLFIGTPIGRLSQKRGAKTILTISMLLFPFIAVAYLLSFNLPTLLAARFLHGIASAMLLPMAMAYIGENSPKGQEGQYMGIYNTILFTASALGPFVSGFVYDKYGIKCAFILLLVLALSSLFIILTFTSKNNGNTGRYNTDNKPGESQEIKTISLRKIWNDKRLLALSSITIASAVLMALLGASFTQLALSYQIKMGTIGLLIALVNIVIGITQVPLGRFVDTRNKIKLFILSGLLTTVLVLFVPLLHNAIGIAVAITVLGLFTSLNLASFSALSAVYGKEAGMGEAMGFLGSVNSTGTIIGYLLLGWIADMIGVPSTFYLSGIIFFIGTSMFYIFWTSKKFP